MEKEELVKLLSNAELDDNAKVEAIQKMVDTSYVPATVVANERRANKEAIANKDKAIADITAEYDEFKKSKMTEEEKKTLEAKEKEKAYNEALKKLSTATAKTVFASAGLKEEDYSDFIEDIVRTDEEKTRTLAEKICQTITKQKSDVATKMKDSIINGTTPPPAGNASFSAKSKKDQYIQLLEEATKKNDINNMVYYQRLVEEEIKKEN